MNNMVEPLVSPETAVLAKEKGFNVNTQYYYNPSLVKDVINREMDWNDPKVISNCNSAPTQSLLQKWLREKYNIHVESFYCESEEYGVEVKVQFKVYFQDYGFNNYEEALENGLSKALNLII